MVNLDSKDAHMISLQSLRSLFVELVLLQRLVVLVQAIDGNVIFQNGELHKNDNNSFLCVRVIRA